MDYNWLESVPSSITAIPTYSPDFSFLQSMQMKANQQYEQGLKEVKSAYASIFNQTVTNDENKKAQQDYARQAQEQMKAISATDLSNPKNVLAAENILAPFHKDQDLLSDISITNDVSTKLQTAESDHQSKDEKIRNTYNPWSVTRLNYVLEDLKLAKRGNGSIQKVEKADYLPITDYQAYVNAQDKAMDFKGIDKETAIEGTLYVKKEHDGIAAVPPLKTRYDAMLGPKFQAEFAQQGWVEHRQEIDRLAKENPNIPREQLNSKLAEKKYSEVLSMYDNNIKETGINLYNTYQLPLKALYDQINLHQGGKKTEEQRVAIDRLENGYKKEDGTYVPGQAQFNSRLDQISTERQQFMDKNPEQMISAIAANPEEYYAKTARQNTINKLAEARASDYSSSLDINKALDAMMTHKENEARIQNERLDRQQRMVIAKMEDATKRAGITKDYTIAGYSIDPVTGQAVSQTASTDGSAAPGGGFTLGQAQADQQPIDATVLLETQKNNALKVATSASFGKDGTSQRLLDLKVSDNDLLQYNTLMQRIFSPEGIDDKNLTQKPEEVTSFQRVRGALSKYLGKEIPNTYGAVAKAQNDFIANEVKTRSNTLGIDMSKDPYNHAYTQSKIAEKAYKEFDGKIKEQQTLVNTIALSDKDTYHKLLNNNNTRFANIYDISEYAPTLEVIDKTNNVKTITPVEYANAYVNKTLEYVDGTQVKIDGKLYSINKVNGKSNVNSSYGDYRGAPKYLFDDAAQTLVNRFGYYTERSELNTKLNSLAAFNMPSLSKYTGKTGVDITYSFGSRKNPTTGEVLPANGEIMIAEALHPSNYTDVKVNGVSVLGDENAELYQKLTTKAGSFEDIKKNLGQPTYSTVSSTGQQVVKFVVKDWDKDKEGNDISATVEIPLSPNPKGTLLSSIPKSSGFYVNSKILEGSITTSDAQDEAMGFKYKIVPDNADHPSIIKVYTSHKFFDPKTKTEYWKDDIEANGNNYVGFNISGSYNPDQIMQGVEQRRFNAIANLQYQRGHYISTNAK
jgi:hypothetical protein